uniref:Ribosomal protein S20 n=1 Tax=Anotrichium furcellatum TaxID=41999 RepID=A0A4D6WL49_9FLOR|nr:ribosomal protein S20 [Anotrichium furcellatum]
MKKNISAIKRNSLSIRNRSQNRSYKSAIKTSIKKFLVVLDKSKNLTSSEDLLKAVSEVYQKIDKAVQKGVIHRNKGSRKKSRLIHMIKTRHI